MPLLPTLILSALASILAGMLLFILARRAWRIGVFRRKDRYREYWWNRLPALLAGATPTQDEMRSRTARDLLETLLLQRLQTAEQKERTQISDLIHRAGLLDYRLQMLRSGSRWIRLHSAALVWGSSAPPRPFRRWWRRWRTPGSPCRPRPCGASA